MVMIVLVKVADEHTQFRESTNVITSIRILDAGKRNHRSREQWKRPGKHRRHALHAYD